jgi:hypothetical protein
MQFEDRRIVIWLKPGDFDGEARIRRAHPEIETFCHRHTYSPVLNSFVMTGRSP